MPAQFSIGRPTGTFARAAVLLLMLALSACETATPYQSTLAGAFGIAGGFDEEDKGDGVWHVSFSANAFTTRETVQTYWLYRCAEFTLENGYDGFEILSDRMRLTLRRHVQLAASAPVPIFVPSGGYDSTMIHNIGADIRLLKAPLVAAPPKIFDARELERALAPYVNGKKCDAGNVCPHEHAYLRAQPPG
jgi:hypothetical protein